MRTHRPWLAVVAALFGTLMVVAVPTSSYAQAPRPTAAVGSKVTVEVMVVQATNEHQRVDPELRAVMQSLRHLRFTGFSVLSTDKIVVSSRSKGSTGVAGGRQLKIELLDVDEKQAKLRFQLMKGDKKVMDTTVSIRRNRTFIVAGPKHGGGVLILPLTVRY